MRAELRRECDEIWVIDCSPEGHQPEVVTRIFQGVQHPVCIVLASRSRDHDEKTPAKVRFRALNAGSRDDKFAELATVTLASEGWRDAALDWRTPFLPEFAGGWADFVPLDEILGDLGSGVMPGRTWAISPDIRTLEDRWEALKATAKLEEKERLFHPQLRKGKIASRHVRKIVSQALFNVPLRPVSVADDNGPLPATVRYGFRSFDRQWLPADTRLLNDPRPKLWSALGPDQIFFTALKASSPTNGPALTITPHVPDQDHYKGSFGGRVFALWKDAAATESNILPAAIATLTKQYGAAVDPVDVFAYVAALLANPAYTEAHRADLIRPGLRVPVTADKVLFDEAAKLGREVIWLHSFGERMAGRRPPGEPRLPEERRPFVPAGGGIPATPEGFPDALDYDPAKQRLKVGSGFVDNVTPAMWAYEVSGKNVLRQWFSYRKRNRERPQIGDRRKPSPLGDIQPDHWLSEYTSELLNVLNVLGLLIDIEPKQADLLKRIEDEPLIPASKFGS